MIKLLTWNILQGGGKRAMAIAEQLVAINPSIVTLQEFRNGKSAPIILDALKKIGLEHQHLIQSTAAKNTVMVAAGIPFETFEWADDLDPALCVRAQFKLPNAHIDTLHIFAGHLPQKRAQVPYLDALGKLNTKDYQAALIIGDLNCGIPFEDSETKSFVNTHMFQNLLRNGWTDSWRTRNLDAREYSWISSRGNGYRYDHCLATEKADKLINKIDYLHGVREEGLSDHSAMLIELSL
ncbi:MAG: endonuclease/exonuclease/phosphatase family protein [Granulosicoccaceae bacterium]